MFSYLKYVRRAIYVYCGVEDMSFGKSDLLPLFFAEQDDQEGNQIEEEETLSFTLASVGEHSINRASESQEALDTHVDATAIVVTPIPAAIHSSRNTSPGDRKLDLVV
jgi:hypothetical protein